jgi:hypothetical protein
MYLGQIPGNAGCRPEKIMKIYGAEAWSLLEARVGKLV